MMDNKNKNAICALLFTGLDNQQSYHSHQPVVTPNEMIGLYCHDYPATVCPWYEGLPSKGSLCGQAQIHTGFHCFTEIGHIFHNKYNYLKKNTFQVEIRPIFCLNDRNPGKETLRSKKLIQTISWGSPPPDPTEACTFGLWFRKSVSIYPRSTPVLGAS